MNLVKFIKCLPVNFDGVAPRAFVRDGMVNIDAEAGDLIADYYGEFNNGAPWVCADLVAYAVANNGFFEWVNPAVIIFVKN